MPSLDLLNDGAVAAEMVVETISLAIDAGSNPALPLASMVASTADGCPPRPHNDSRCESFAGHQGHQT